MIKQLTEKRAKLLGELDAMMKSLEKDGEIRAFTDEEQRDFDAKSKEVESLNATISALKEQRNLAVTEPADARETEPAKAAESGAEAEERAFVEYLRAGGNVSLISPETRADSNFTKTDNGAVIPTSIAQKIIEKISEISPVYSTATLYNVGGTLTIPYYDTSSGDVTMAYADEFSTLTSTSGKFASITLTGFLAAALCKVSRSLINNSQFDILGYVINKTAEAAVRWLDKELINGTESKIEGLSKAQQIVTAASENAVTADELIDLQDMIPDAYQNNSVWVMSRATRSFIRKLKDGDGNFLLNKDATAKWGYSLFGKPVYIADCVSDMTAEKPAIYYGDFSGLAVKTSENMNIQILTEKFAEQHAYGVLAWMEIDAKIENQQKIAVLKMASAD